ncbi:MAG: hypothetical protein AB1896_14450, partial [Thermodesulfobacteriota bacterium]
TDGEGSAMNQILDYRKMHHAAAVLGGGLPSPAGSTLPVEAAEVIERARRQMEQVPAALNDLAAARRDFVRLDRALVRLFDLARRSGELPEEDRDGRLELEVDFRHEAAVVARLAGRRFYRGPRLSIRTRAQAEGTRLILRHLLPVKEALAEQLEEQEALLVQAVGETINFLEEACRAWPDDPSLIGVPDLLRRVGWFREAYPPVNEVGQDAYTGRH